MPATTDPSGDPEMKRFDAEITRIGERYEQYLLIVRTEGGQMMWKSRDKTWAVGAATRYLNCTEELDRIDERRDRE